MGFDRNGQEQQNGDSRNDWENARENWEKWEKEQEKKNWDKWDSNASHSSYYNQPTHPPYDQGFSIASIVCGILSITLGCCSLSLPLGAMGILFAVLCRRKKRPGNSNGSTGLCLSIFGCIYGTVNLVYQVFRSLHDPVFIQQMQLIYEQLYR